ncbi:NAD(P)(+) transhydrogenase (Re/Si-specific) subunit alpha [Acidiferrimicrobium sp. IK]|uniref:NAD(P)(+) transhydrogenase (Re/Si-specific) subunit alpha n=1 Tax=Acidiferrimicrobium sp. IK TaxID=2871700 RepID=UPI0021CB2B8C|nr:NAD(P)(+) transhydrogenase (Re/Si-specific) subunit alpha [Acidiferrimicrobium sp. IK]MCU4184462.1 NAD(P)(+) transhydrogenase (Re/Si-specific) subunit alpha [Acidiferrimicrobium sp. IK]
MSEIPDISPGRRQLIVAAVREDHPEGRVALVPDAAARLAPLGAHLWVESGAGDNAWMDDERYREAGATVVASERLAEADVVVTVGRLPGRVGALLRPGQTVIGLLQPLVYPDDISRLASSGVTAISLDALPRTESRAQAMDALSSQANVAGYKAVLVAADSYGSFFPLLITAAGTAKPAQVLVLGAGVAGLQAMGTARRLGAVVTGYDVRPAAQADIESVGARVLHLDSVAAAAGEGGYARALSDTEQAAQAEELAAALARFDVVITTAQVPGRRPPLLVTAQALTGMKAGSVVVDLASSALGGNVEGSQAGQRIVTASGVTVVGAGDLPSQVPVAASVAYSHNVCALLAHIVHDGSLDLDLSDTIQAAVVVARGAEAAQPERAAAGGGQL